MSPEVQDMKQNNQSGSRDWIIISRAGLTVENTSKENLEIMKFIIKQAKRQLTKRRNQHAE